MIISNGKQSANLINIVSYFYTPWLTMSANAKIFLLIASAKLGQEEVRGGELEQAWMGE